VHKNFLYVYGNYNKICPHQRSYPGSTNNHCQLNEYFDPVPSKISNFNTILFMVTKEFILKTLRQNKPFFEKEMGVISIGLFGSYAKEMNKSESDVDILVELRPPLANNFFALWIKLEKALNKKVDLVRKGNHLSERFLQTVEKEERLEYILDHTKSITVYFSGILQPADFKDFPEGNRTLDAIITRLQALGENIKKIEKIIKFRDFISHHYEKPDIEIVFEIYRDDIPELTISVQKFFKKT